MIFADLPTVLVGALLGSALAVVARRRGRRRGTVLLAVGLGVASALYVLFAVVGRAPVTWIALEVAGLVAYGAVAYFGRRRPLVVAAGWLAHVAWDVALHNPEPAFVPGWYPWLCLGFDVVVAAGAVALIRREASR